MKKMKFVILFISLILTTHSANAETIIERIRVAEVVIKETYRNGVLTYTEWFTIESNDSKDFYLTATHDRRENGTGNVYYCYGRKYGYCSVD